MSTQKNVLENMLEDQLRKLSVRILLKDEKNRYIPQGSGLLYLTDDGGYVLTACHVLDKFGAADQVFVECHPDDADKGKKHLKKYMFSLPLEKVWSFFKGKVPKAKSGSDFNEKDVAVIPLTEAEKPVRPWMKDRSRALFMPEIDLTGIRGRGYGYPGFTKKQDIAAACTRLNMYIHCEEYSAANHYVKWTCSEKLSFDERHGLSGSLVVMHGLRSVVLTSVVLRTHENHDGKVIQGTDLLRLRELLDLHNVQIREAVLEDEQRISKYIRSIETYLRKDCAESLSCLANNLDLRRDTKERYKAILEKVLGFGLSDLSGGRTHCMDCGCKGNQLAVRIAPCASREEMAQMRESYLDQHMDRDYPHMILMAVTDDAGSAEIPNLPDHVMQDVWDIPCLVGKIAGLPDDRIQDIFRDLDRRQTSISAVEMPQHLLPYAPDPSKNFIEKSRDTNIASFRELMEKEPPITALFISGIGGIGKTEMAIQLAWYYKPAKGAYFIEYVVPEPDANGNRMEAMKATILNANFSDHSRDGRSDDDEFEKRMEYLCNEYKDALLIIDNFDWQGEPLETLLNEKSYKKLRDLKLQLILTTRYSPESVTGLQIGSIGEPDLLELMQKHCKNKYATEAELRELLALTDWHTLAADLMAKTLKSGHGRITPAHIRQLLTNGPAGLPQFPKVKCDKQGFGTPDTLFGHLRKLFTPAGLKSEQKSILCCALLTPRDGLDSDWFFDSLDPGEGVGERSNIVDQLIEMGWVIEDSERDTIRMDPLLRCICRHELELDLVLCGSFLDGLWEIHNNELSSDDRGQLDLAECFDNAAMLVADPAAAAHWKTRADLIRNGFPLGGGSSDRPEQEQEVGT